MELKQIEIIGIGGILMILTIIGLGGYALYHILNTDPQYWDNEPAYCGVVGSSSYDLGFAFNRLSEEEKAMYREGQVLFLEKCAACHNNNMWQDLTGPALKDVTKRWANRPALYRFIRSSQEVIAEGEDKYVDSLWKAWEPTIMNNFSELQDGDIDAILIYIESKPIR